MLRRLGASLKSEEIRKNTLSKTPSKNPAPLLQANGFGFMNPRIYYRNLKEILIK